MARVVPIGSATQVLEGHVDELRLVVRRPRVVERVERPRPQVELGVADHAADVGVGVPDGRLGRQRARRGDAGDRVAVRVDDERVGVDGHQRVERGHVGRVLEHPALLGVVEADQLEVLLVARVGVGPVLALQPLGVARHVGQRLVGVGLAGLPQQPPALLDGRGIHVVDAHELRALDVVRRERLLHRAEDRVVVPGLARRPRLRVLRQPHLQPLRLRVGVQQPVQRGGAGARQAHHEDRPLDRHVGVLGVRGELRLGEQHARPARS